MSSEIPTVKNQKERTKSLYQNYLAALGTEHEDEAYVEYSDAWLSYWISWQVNPDQRKDDISFRDDVD